MVWTIGVMGWGGGGCLGVCTTEVIKGILRARYSLEFLWGGWRYLYLASKTGGLVFFCGCIGSIQGRSLWSKRIYWK